MRLMKRMLLLLTRLSSASALLMVKLGTFRLASMEIGGMRRHDSSAIISRVLRLHRPLCGLEPVYGLHPGPREAAGRAQHGQRREIHGGAAAGGSGLPGTLPVAQRGPEARVRDQ